MQLQFVISPGMQLDCSCILQLKSGCYHSIANSAVISVDNTNGERLQAIKAFQFFGLVQVALLHANAADTRHIILT